MQTAVRLVMLLHVDEDFFTQEPESIAKPKKQDVQAPVKVL